VLFSSCRHRDETVSHVHSTPCNSSSSSMGRMRGMTIRGGRPHRRRESQSSRDVGAPNLRGDFHPARLRRYNTLEIRFPRLEESRRWRRRPCTLRAFHCGFPGCARRASQRLKPGSELVGQNFAHGKPGPDRFQTLSFAMAEVGFRRARYFRGQERLVRWHVEPAAVFAFPSGPAPPTRMLALTRRFSKRRNQDDTIRNREQCVRS
jgi:hypothetical protein